jgi:hypothetical protein
MHDTAGAFSTAALSVTINGADDAPAQPQDTDLNSNSVSENAANCAAVGITASATDIDGGALTYRSQTMPADASRLIRRAASSRLRMGSLLDFETSPTHMIVCKSRTAF